MKTKFLIVMITTVLLSARSQENVKVEIKEMSEMQIVYYENTGPYDQAFNDFPTLMSYLQSNKIPLGAHSLGIFFDDPQQVPENKLRSEIGFLVTDKVKTKPPFKYKKLDACKAVSAKYTSMDEIMTAYQAISNYIMEHKLKTAPYSIEIYYSYEEGSVDAEIFMPIVE